MKKPAKDESLRVLYESSYITSTEALVGRVLVSAMSPKLLRSLKSLLLLHGLQRWLPRLS